MEFGMEQVQSMLDKGISEAQSVISNPSKVDDLLIQLEEKLKSVPAIGRTLADLPLMMMLAVSYAIGRRVKARKI